MNAKETLEEATESNALFELEKYQPTKERFKLSCKNSFLRGFKFNQERSYSEEEVLKIILSHTDFLYKDKELTLTDWFKQFKKK